MAKVKSREVDIARLCAAMQRSRLTLRRYREERTHAVRQYCGYHYSEEGSSKPQPVNLLALYVGIVSRQLIAKNPRVMLSVFNRSNKPIVSAMQTWANKEIEVMHLDNTLQRVVVDALFSVGICKVALATPAESAAVSWSLRAGQPFAERVDLDDFVFDVHARDFNECAYIGHRYRVPLEVVRDSTIYNKSRKDLTASTDQFYNQEGDYRVSTIGRGFYGDTEEFEDMVDLWEVYLPRHRVVLTLADEEVSGASSSRTGEALRQQGWLGPDCGPYHILAFGVVPGNAMPKAPIMDLIDLHEGANNAYRKIMRQAQRIKEITLARSTGGTRDAEAFEKANDGDIIPSDDPNNISNIVSGGQSAQTIMALATMMKDLFDQLGGNLSLLSGAAPQSPTAAQDKILNQNSSMTITAMQDSVLRTTSSVICALCWYWHHDPFKVMKTQHSLPGLPSLQLARAVTPQMRAQGSFEDLDIKVDPYSMQPSTPQTRMAALNQMVQQVIIPMMSLLVQQGKSFDINAYLQKAATYLDMPDLQEIVTITEVPQTDLSSGKPDGPGMPAQTERTYNRTNTPMRTQRGDDQNLINSSLGINTGGNPNKPQTNGAMK